MKISMKVKALLAALPLCAGLCAQSPQPVAGADERFKTEILVVLAHPDDEAYFSPYLLRAIHDEQKRVAIVYATRGGSGDNGVGREHGPALANAREMEAREACSRLGIAHVWFLDGKDTASQYLMNSLGNWGHGANLERLVSLIRLTRPSVVLTQLPAVFIGEDHGDHQAIGVLATEAFDLAGDPLIFPEQLAGNTNQFESYQSNLQPWQASKLYYASDADNLKQFVGFGPAYSVREVSPSLKKPYWRLAMESVMAHQTQYAREIAQFSQMSDEALERTLTGPGSIWWPEPETLIFGKSLVGGAPTDEVFAHIGEQRGGRAASLTAAPETQLLPRIELGGAWGFYAGFYRAHGLVGLPVAKVAEIAVWSGSTLVVPLVFRHDPAHPMTVKLTVEAPEGWKAAQGTGEFLLPAEASTSLSVQIATPLLSADALKKTPQEVVVRAEAEGKPAGEAHLRVLLNGGTLP